MKTLRFYHIFLVHLGILEVLYCVLIESPEVLNIIQENHIKSIISLLDKHGRNHKVCLFSLPGNWWMSNVSQLQID